MIPSNFCVVRGSSQFSKLNTFLKRFFEIEKIKLIAAYKKLIAKGEEAVDGTVHPLFGKMTAYECGFSQWKHFDHHLKQFNA